ncbi:MAG: GntR family transcriptional regulator [Hyphomicrobiaceae bacterium]
MAIAQLELQPVLIEQVENRLIDAIIDGTLASGTRLTQESAAAMLGVSRQPVSHALQALRRRGLLIEHGKRGLQVAPLDASRIRDLYRVRAALDGLAAECAANNVKRGIADTTVLAHARDTVRRGQALPPDASVSDRIAADVAFHSAIHTLSNNSAITETVHAQWPHFMRSMALVLTDSQIRARVWDEHAGILSAILAHDVSGAAALARCHTELAGEETATRLERLNQQTA